MENNRSRLLDRINKRERGITLIALVVTIIVLLILAGISIAMLTGQNGILNRAAEAKEKTGVAQEDERQKLKGYEDIMAQYTGSLPSREETKPYFPNSTFSYKEGDLSTGLVIKDSNDNEYVWVEVPKTVAVYPTAGVNISSFTDDEYTKIETDLHTYTNDYRKETSYSDTWYDAKDDSNEEKKLDWYQSESDYNTAKQKMLKSVYQNGGFWVGRYEAGIENEVDIRKSASSTATLIPVTKQNMYPYTYITRTQAKVLAEKVESGNYTSSLMFGVQWDLVLKYIETKNLNQKSNLLTNSTPIGNYKNSLWNITNTNAKYSTDYGSSFTAYPKPKTENASILLTTGADISFSLMNIYDLAGNVWEWTLEKTSEVSVPCTNRGGSCSNDGSLSSASNRDSSVTSGSGYNVGFRLSLY